MVIPEECGRWSDTGETRVSSYGTYSRTGNMSGTGANRKCKESRTNQREKQQKCTTNAPYNNTRYQWIGTTSATETRWVSCPEPEPCGPWGDTGEERAASRGKYSNTGSTRGCGPDKECRQSRTVRYEKEQERVCDSGNRTETRWVFSRTATEYRWVDCPEALRWGNWTDTGNTRENEFDYSIEKEQRRTSHCNTTQTRWVAA